jgi:hypothetical protein
MNVISFLDPSYPKPEKKKIMKVYVVGEKSFLPLVNATLEALEEAYNDIGTTIVFDVYHHGSAKQQ